LYTTFTYFSFHQGTAKRNTTVALKCRKDSFTCDNGQCIYKQWRCDGVKDCSDGSDEYCPCE